MSKEVGLTTEGEATRNDAAAHALELKSERRRRAIFILLAILGTTALLLGIRLGDPETIHRFAAQI
uniref:Uncharacterized protein n=1 Tax=candidate division WOR-3 bacterium TaxID=2052148 RepID=A0A7C4CAB3_UNCW3